ncbi:MAG: ATP-binding protein [Pseudomonadota bacterium]
MQGKPLSLINHDIRSALGDVVGGLHLIDDIALDPASRQQLERVRAAGEALERLLTEGLRLAGTDDARGSDARDPADPESAPAESIVMLDLFNALERRWGGHAAALGLDFVARLNGDLPTSIRTRAIELERILSNLLDNALKYAEFGRISLAVDKREDGALVFTVCDEGPGFSDAALGRLFSFGGRPRDATQPGTGLGLHIAKELADRASGTLSVANLSDRSGKITGACVALVLPREVWTAEPACLQRDPLPDLTGKTVLVAEDNATAQLLFSRMLRNLGATVELAGDGMTARAALSELDVDLAIVDIQMPGLSGLDVISGMRATGSPGRRVPIVAATAYVLSADRERIYAAGADAILAKPVLSLSALAHAITVALDASALRKDTERAEDRPHDGPAADEQVREPLASRLAQLVEIAGPEGRDELLLRLDNDVSGSVQSLCTAITTRNISATRMQTHVLISLTGAVGAGGLQSIMEQMNSASHRSDWTFLDKSLAKAQPSLRRLGREIQRLRKGICRVEQTWAPPA